MLEKLIPNGILRNIVSVVLIAVTLIVAKAWYDRGQREIGAAKEREKAAVKYADSLNKVSRRIDSVYIVQEKVNTRVRTKWDTVYKILRTLDSVVYRDTIVRKVVETADSAIQSCNALVVTCGERTAILLQRIHADSTILRATTSELSRAKIRNRIGCFAGGVGAVIQGTVKAGFGVGCGVRIW